MIVKLDALDEGIVRQLVADPRATNAALARLVGLSESAVAVRVNRMVAEKALRLTVERDALSEGLELHVLALVEVDPEFIDDVALKISALSEIDVVFGTERAGALTLLFFAADMDHLNSVVSLIESVSDKIQFVGVHIAGEVYKYSTSYGLLS